MSSFGSLLAAWLKSFNNLVFNGIWEDDVLDSVSLRGYFEQFTNSKKL